ncbi:CheY-like superfamily [Penicillium italicum]|uniref:histidine kinase n=1 Tax=Penicillium italicum TaxID=40296 RepID=A0A0A2KYB4_PENIT|nr:CheY-like superfamily [Penicillium italicum]
MAALGGAAAQSRYRLTQEREFYKYVPREHSASHYAPFDHASENTFIPQPSRDSALTSFAQLGAIRLGTRRALVSLFDKTHQHIVAEATQTLSLIGGRVQNERDRLRLGCCLFPKERGFCQQVEQLPSWNYSEADKVVGDSSVVVLDVKENESFRSRQVLHALCDVRFYASVPIVSPKGFTIGAYSVMDYEPRTSNPDQHDLQFMKDMAATVMEHLAMGHSTQKNRQAERMVVGLGSFVEGRSTLRDSWREANAQYAASEQSGETTEGQLDIQQQDLQKIANGKSKKNLVIRQSSKISTEGPGPASNGRNEETRHRQEPGIEVNKADGSVRSVIASESLQDDSLNTGIKHVFSRAANLIRESIGAEGVMFLDANSERFGNLVKQTSRKVSGPNVKDPTSSSDESTDSASSSNRNSSKDDQEDEADSTLVSECMGFSSSRVSSINEQARAGQAVVVPEPLFSSLIRRYPNGKIFTYDAYGMASEDSNPSRNLSEPDQATTSGAPRTKDHRPASKRRRKPTYRQDASNLIKIFGDARNILLLPIWDSDRNRWYAGTLVWTNDPEHIFTTENELAYISAFANSIMAEIRRLDVELAEKAKTNLVSSISHELRNPLHGILGTADILSDTAMNALQHGMVHTIESCGRTLLDIINNLLDLTFINKYQKKLPGSRGKRRSKQVSSLPAGAKDVGRVQSNNHGEDLSYSHVQLDAVLEEVTECVFAGYSFYTHPQAPPPALSDTSSRWGGPTSKSDAVGPRASQITIIFDIQPDTEWDFNTHVGAWRRILMNVFGNALKYTPSGYIYLGLSSSQLETGLGDQERGFEVTLTVKDTGKGIGTDFLQNGLFTSFSQEDPLASGSGLGLSIVRQAVGFLGGSIEIESTQGVGTTISVRTPLTRTSHLSDTSSSSYMFSSLQKYTQDKTIGFLGFGLSLQSHRDTALYSSLERLCSDWFGLQINKVFLQEDENMPCDFYLAVQTELDSENIEGRNLFGLSQRLANRDGCCSPVVVICQSPEEAHRMFVAAKNRDQTPLFEFISQPCGPRKLARALDICIKRQLDGEVGQPSADEPTRWVEMPESSHLPVDLGATEAPKDRMKISKRPTVDTMGSPERRNRSQFSTRKGSSEAGTLDTAQLGSYSRDADGDSEIAEQSVLLVDDNDLNLQLLCAYTKKDKCNYMTAKNGAEAVEIFKAHPDKFQVIIIGMFTYLIPLHLYCVACYLAFLASDGRITLPDISMPIMDGFEASRQIRRAEKEHRARTRHSTQKSPPATFIAALTGLDSPNAQKEAFGSGIDTFLIKPVKRPDLHAILQRVIE